MKKLHALAATTLLTFTASSFAQGIYVQGGGGLGVIDSGLESWGFNYLLNNSLSAFKSVAHTKNEMVGTWTAGIGYMFTDMWGVEANYIDFGKHHDKVYTSATQGADSITMTGNLKTEVYQVNLLAVASVPLSKEYGVNLKGKAGAVYTYHKQSSYMTDQVSNIISVNILKSNYNVYDTKPMVSVGLEKSVTNGLGLSLDYYAEIDANFGSNSSLLFTAKFMPMALMEQQKSRPTEKPAFKHS